MEWNLIERPEAVIVEMLSNPVNKQNPESFADLHRAFDRLDREFPHKPAVLTGKGSLFCVGLDLDYCLPLFARADEKEMRDWFTAYRATMLRVFTSPRLTIAAVNGHAFAGGLILALCCDFRIGAAGSAKFAVNEVPIGIPMPSAFTEILRYRLGNRVASESILLGRTTGVDQARALGYLTDVVPPEALLERALVTAGEIVPDCWPAYVQAKKSLLHPTLLALESFGKTLDEETTKVMVSPASLRMHERTLQKLKAKK